MVIWWNYILRSEIGRKTSLCPSVYGDYCLGHSSVMNVVVEGIRPCVLYAGNYRLKMVYNEQVLYGIVGKCSCLRHFGAF